MKAIRNIAYMIISLTILCSGCAEDKSMPDNLIGAEGPKVNFIKENLTISATQAVVYGKIESLNGAPVTEKGFIWYMEGEEPQYAKEEIGESEEGVFYTTLKNLKDSTEYVIRAYARNVAGEGQSERVTFKTNSGLAGVKIIDTPVDVRSNRAVVKAEITDPGEGAILEKGIIYKEKNAEIYRDTVLAKSEEGHFFDTELLNLTPETEYSIMAFVKNSFGITIDKQEINIQTTDGRPVITDLKTEELEETYATFSAEVTDEGDSPVIRRGFIYSTSREGMDGPEAVTIEVGSGELFSQKLTDLAPHKLYFITAFATNEAHGTITSDTVQFTLKSKAPTVLTSEITIPRSGELKMGGIVVDNGMGASLISSGFVYSTAPNPRIETGKVKLFTDKNFSATIRGLRGGETYYVCAFATNSNNLTSYGEEESIKVRDIFEQEVRFPGAYIQEGASYAADAISSKGYLVGGSRGGSLSDEFWEFNPVGPSWKNLPSLPFKRAYASFIHNGTIPIIFGGLDDNNRPLSSLMVFNNNVWSYKAALPSGRYCATAALYRGSMYIVGGRGGDNSDPTTIIDDVWSYLPLNGSWLKRSALPIAQYNCVVQSVGGYLYAGLGSISDTGHTNRFFRYDEVADVWEELPSMPGGKALGSAILTEMIDNVKRDIIYVVDDQGYLRKFNPYDNTWSMVSTPLPVNNRKIHCIYGTQTSDGDKLFIGLGNYGTELISYDPGWDN